MDNMEIYEKVKSVPDEAKKEIQAGRLKGFTDVNPMWRIKRLTETFGPCGIGWWYKITDKRIVDDPTTNQRAAFVDIELYVKYNGEVSQPIAGTGGAMFVAQESRGAYLSDECFKMALTDAISVSAKALGVAADVYFAKDRSKYTNPPDTNQNVPKDKPKRITPQQYDELIDLIDRKGADPDKVLETYHVKKLSELLIEQFAQTKRILEAREDINPPVTDPDILDDEDNPFLNV